VTFFDYLALGLATSLHCVAMCGSLVLTYTVKDGAEGGLVRRLAPHLVYHAAKIVSYMAVALVLGAIAFLAGGALDLTSFRDWVMVVAGAYMVLLGLGMSGYFPWLMRLSPRPPAFLTKALAKNRRRAISESGSGHAGFITPLTFGLFGGLMPCAPLIGAQAAAMSSGSPLRGAMLMLGFGLGTAPLLLLFGLASGMLGSTFRRRMQYVAAAAVVLFGLVILNRGLMLVGSPVTFDSMKAVAVPSATGPDAGSSAASDVPLVIENVRFVPDTLAVPADRPVRLVVDRREDNSCSDQLAIPQLGILADLKPFAKTVVEVPATRAGAYTLTCGMGMMTGRIVFGSSASTDSPSRIALAAIAALLLSGAGWLFVRARRKRGTAEPVEVTAAGDPAVGQAAGDVARILGFTPIEAVVVVVAVALAVLAGLYFGGMFG
jgi:sulfite exporter TauE/SafE